MVDNSPIERLRAIAWLVLASSLAACSAAGTPLVSGAALQPFDAFQASLRLEMGMPQDVAIEAIGLPPNSGRVTHCGVLAAQSATCQVLKFGSENNRLDVYVEATDDGQALVSGWLVQKG